MPNTINVANLTTGTIIRSTAADMPHVTHTGLVLAKDDKVLIAHNTPMRKNAHGGNILVEPLEDFLATGRTITGYSTTKLTYERIMAAVAELKSTPFHPLNFNCNDFIKYVQTGRKPLTLLQTLNSMLLQSKTGKR
jgi:hypothetical protein